MTLLTFILLAQLTLTCEQVRNLHSELGPDEFRRRAAALGLSETQMKAAMACIGRGRELR